MNGRKTRAPIGAIVILACIAAVAVFAPWLAPENPEEIVLIRRLAPPFWMEGGSIAHPLGTDSLGRDILSRLIFGSRVSLIVGLVAVAAGAGVGIALGLATGYYGGVLDNVIMRIGDVQLAFPFILLAIALMAVLGEGLGNVILVLSIRSWVPYARMVRGQVLALKEQEFVQAVRAIGAKDWRITVKHILPNVAAPVIVLASFSVARTIIAEASLSFLGLGVGVSAATWGAMISQGKDYLTDAWWISGFPGLAIMITVLSINLIGDWLRDSLDPSLKY
ncbi:MAG: ABC transporter permease [Candidatus Methanomethylophilus sp.]|nr:ABC transporter permease [Methanomethylophilus sp.]